jgi:YfiH family protein
VTVPLFRFSSIALPHAVSTRHGGVSPAPYDTLNLGYSTPDKRENVAANRAAFYAAAGVDPSTIMVARLTHGNEVSVFRRDRPDDFPVERLPVRDDADDTDLFFSTDAVVSDVPGLNFLLTFADCVPLLFHDPVRDVVGVAHAGWRGTAASIGPRVVTTMASTFGSSPSDIRAAIGPSIGACCYPVGAHVVERFHALGSDPVLRPDGVHLDLWATNERQLRSAGVEHVEVASVCTSCNRSDFFSHRGEQGRTGRFALCAGLA